MSVDLGKIIVETDGTPLGTKVTDSSGGYLRVSRLNIDIRCDEVITTLTLVNGDTFEMKAKVEGTPRQLTAEEDRHYNGRVDS